MSRTLDVLKQVYKPLRVTLKGKTTILETMDGKYLVKEKSNQDIRKIYDYLNSRGFDNFPNLIDDNRTELNVYEYLEDTNTPIEQKGLDMIDVVSSLHKKTAYYKSVSEDRYKEIYEDVLNNINYLKQYYEKLFDRIDEENYMSPSHYLLIRNASKILSSLEFSKKELDDWYEIVKKKNKQRVCLIHNNLTTDHFIKKDKGYLVSWENSKIDTPVLDLVSFYKHDYFNIDFETILEKYLKQNKLDEEEKKLFFIIIAIVDKIDIDDNEFMSCKKVREGLDYLFITEQLIRPYYSVDEKKEQE